MAEDDVDFAVAAYRDEGEWQVVELNPPSARTSRSSVTLGAIPVRRRDVRVLGVDERRLLRDPAPSGTQVRAMLSDITAVTDWPLAVGVADLLDLPNLDDDDEPQAAGDLEILSDLGMPALDLGVLCDDDDLYPEDILRDVADRLGFGDAFEAVIG